jgi:phage terminase Nu1 subunit (DNA packaging protein)
MRREKQSTKEGKPATGLLSQSKYAKQRGCSQPYISKMVRKGVITTVDGKIDPKLADQQLAAAAHPGRINGSGEKPKNYYDALTEHTEYKAALAQLDYEEKCGRLVSVDAIEKEAARIGKAVRDKMLTIPKRLAGDLAAETDQHRIMILLTDEIHRALESLNGNSAPRRSRSKARAGRSLLARTHPGRPA